jgi:cytochrome P450
LTFGESLGQLTSSRYDTWVEAVFSHMKFISMARLGREWGLTRLLNLLIPSETKIKQQRHIQSGAAKVDRRMAMKTERPDIWTYVTKNQGPEDQILAPSELHSNGALFMLAGTETTATELSGLTYMLLKSPEKLARLTKEVRTAFKTTNDMTMVNLLQLHYLQACIEEGLRMYPPVAGGLARVTPENGAEVCGRWVPGGVSPYILTHLGMQESMKC